MQSDSEGNLSLTKTSRMMYELTQRRSVYNISRSLKMPKHKNAMNCNSGGGKLARTPHTHNVILSVKLNNESTKKGRCVEI